MCPHFLALGEAWVSDFPSPSISIIIIKMVLLESLMAARSLTAVTGRAVITPSSPPLPSPALRLSITAKQFQSGLN